MTFNFFECKVTGDDVHPRRKCWQLPLSTLVGGRRLNWVAFGVNTPCALDSTMIPMILGVLSKDSRSRLAFSLSVELVGLYRCTMCISYLDSWEPLDGTMALLQVSMTRSII